MCVINGINSVYSRNNWPNTNDGTYVINLDKFKSIGTHWIALYMNGNNILYFDSFGVKHIPKEIKKIIGDKNVIRNIFIECKHIRFDNVWIFLNWIYWFYVKKQMSPLSCVTNYDCCFIW